MDTSVSASGLPAVSRYCHSCRCRRRPRGPRGEALQVSGVDLARVALRAAPAEVPAGFGIR